jgi:hypothetical protein
MAAYARHNPSTYDLTGMSETQFDALRVCLLLLLRQPNEHDPHSDDEKFEHMRLRQIAARELIEITTEAVYPTQGDNQ